MTYLTLKELYSTNDMSLLKDAIADLVNKRDYRLLNILLRHNPNASKFDSRILNKDIPQENKRFAKRNDKLCITTKSTIPKKKGILLGSA